MRGCRKLESVIRMDDGLSTRVGMTPGDLGGCRNLVHDTNWKLWARGLGRL